MLLEGIDEGLTPFLMMDCCKSRKMCGVIREKDSEERRLVRYAVRENGGQ
jgi:hypothetical protein